MLQLCAENSYLPDLDELKSLITDNRRLIVLNTPNNLSGSAMDRAILQAVAHIADPVGAYVLCDDVPSGIKLSKDNVQNAAAPIIERFAKQPNTEEDFTIGQVVRRKV